MAPSPAPATTTDVSHLSYPADTRHDTTGRDPGATLQYSGADSAGARMLHPLPHKRPSPSRLHFHTGLDDIRHAAHTLRSRGHPTDPPNSATTKKALPRPPPPPPHPPLPCYTVLFFTALPSHISVQFRTPRQFDSNRPPPRQKLTLSSSAYGGVLKTQKLPDCRHSTRRRPGLSIRVPQHKKIRRNGQRSNPPS